MNRPYVLLLLSLAACKLPDLIRPDHLRDDDQDGSTADLDCDDHDEARYPGAEDACDGVDNDCDETPDNQLDVTGGTPFWGDADDDGYGDPAAAHTACSMLEGYAASGDDCDDSDDGIHPNAVDLCNDRDDDCDDVKDEDADGVVWLDADTDTFGDPQEPWCGGGVPTGYVANYLDCDDGFGLTYPGADEWCDLEDNDCDDVVDEDAIDMLTLCRDQDDDSLGNPEHSIEVCVNPGGEYEFDCTDCDDSDVDVGASRDWFSDVDEDTYGDPDDLSQTCEAPDSTDFPWVLRAGDCAPGEAGVNPGVLEVCANQVDDDCDAATNCRFPASVRVTGTTLDHARFDGHLATQRAGTRVYTMDLDDDGLQEALTAEETVAGPSEIIAVRGNETRASGIYDLHDVTATTFAPDGEGSALFGASAIELDLMDPDAFHEIAIGDPGGNFLPGLSTGSAYVFYSDSGVVASEPSGQTPYPVWTPDLRIDGKAEGDELGVRLVRTPGAGGDEYAFAVSAPGANADDGSIYIVEFGSFTHIDGVSSVGNVDTAAYIYEWPGPAGATRFGTGMAFFHGPASAASLAVGATLTPDLGSGTSLDGALYIFRVPTSSSVSTAPDPMTAPVRIYGLLGASGGFGTNVANVGDVNGDGVDDLAVSAPTYNFQDVNHRGKVYIISGAIPNGTVARIDALAPQYFIGGFVGPQSDAQFGSSLAGGDVDGDGLSDVMFGAPSFDSGGTDTGSAWLVFGRQDSYGIVYLGDNGDTTGGTRFYTTADGDQIGRGLACGDVDGDGLDDVLLGTPGYDAASLRQNAGAVFLVYGNGQ